jgi:coproporphyrinogen III oxidase-like Fe-S oxidoreductase
MMGLRTTYGIQNSQLQTFFGKNYQQLFRVDELQKLVEYGYLILEEDCIRTTPAGLSILNSLLPKILNAEIW